MNDAQFENSQEEQMYSIEATATLLSLSPWTIRSWISQKKIASCKLGSRRVIPALEIKRIISEAFVERAP